MTILMLQSFSSQCGPPSGCPDQKSPCLDITGCAHLFGGEAPMLNDISRRLAGFSIQAQMAIADSLGAAWAVARYGGDITMIVPQSGARAALDRLPVSALRLSA